MTDLCSSLYQNFDHTGWNEFDLATLPANELRFLCRIMGAPFYGTKEIMVVRLLSLRIVRKELSAFQDDPATVVISFKRSRLRWMCEQANLWKSGSKVQLAAVLLSWRNKCRLEGQKFLNECIKHTKRSGFQMTLGL